MSLLGRAIQGLETRSTLSQPSSSLTESLTGGATYSGRSVSVEASMRLVPVYSGVSLLAGAVGSMPLIVYKRQGKGRERATGNWMWQLLHVQPNAEMAADELWEIVTAHLLLWGNAFLMKVGHPVYPIGELWPIRPNRVQVGVDADTGERYYVLDGKDRYTNADILHIRGLGTDGVVGLSPIQQARQMLAGAMEQEEYLGRFYANNAHPGGVLQHPNKLSNEAATRLKASWKAAHGGAKRAGEVAVLEEGLTWQSTGMPLEDAQFIETARFSLLQVALLLRLPPKMMGASTGDSLTYTSSEWESLDFVRWSLRRLLVRIEGSLMRDTDLFPQSRKFYPEFLIEAILRGTSKERAEFYEKALDPKTGWMVREEVRHLENLGEETAPAKPPPASDPASSSRHLLSPAMLNGGPNS